MGVIRCIVHVLALLGLFSLREATDMVDVGFAQPAALNADQAMLLQFTQIFTDRPNTHIQIVSQTLLTGEARLFLPGKV